MKQRVITPEVWERIRRDYEQGVAVVDICRHYGVGKSSVWRHAKDGGWIAADRGAVGVTLNEDIARAVSLLPQDKVGAPVVAALANVVARDSNPRQVRGELMVEQVISAAQIMRAQMRDWQEHRAAYPYEIFYEEKDISLRRAKLAADMLAARHAGERRAYGILDDQTALREINGAHEMTDDQLADIIQAAGGTLDV